MIKKILKWCGIAFSCVALVFGSFFLTKQKTTSYVASADNVTVDYTFIGSNLLTVATGYNSYSDSSLTWGLANISLSFSTHSNNSVDVNFSTKSMTGSNFENFVTLSDNFQLTTSNETSRKIQFDNYVYFQYWIQCNDITKFVADIYKIRIRSVEYSNDFWTYITYFDVNDNWLQYSVRVFNYNQTQYNNAKMFMYDDRSYFTNTDLSDSQQYNAGYSQGLLDNQQNVYNNGYQAGKTDGYANGFNQGVLESNDYSFLGLMSSVVDAPIKAISGLLDFEILGFNMLNFAFGLLSIGVIVFVFKIIKGR